jgi:hypothetical protein
MALEFKLDHIVTRNGNAIYATHVDTTKKALHAALSKRYSGCCIQDVKIADCIIPTIRFIHSVRDGELPLNMYAFDFVCGRWVEVHDKEEVYSMMNALENYCSLHDDILMIKDLMTTKGAL